MHARQGSREGGRGKYTQRAFYKYTQACPFREEGEDRLVQSVPVFSLTCSSSDLSQFPACDRGCTLLLFYCSRETTAEAPCVKVAFRGPCPDNDDDDDGVSAVIGVQHIEVPNLGASC